MEYLGVIFQEVYKILFLLFPVLVSVAMIVWLDRKRHISTRVCVSREVFCEAVSFVDNNNKKKTINSHTVSTEYAGLDQTNHGG